MVNVRNHLIQALLGIVLTVSLAACGGGSGSSSAVAVPNVVGSTQAAATTSITGAGLTVGTVTSQSSTTVASGDVISENPAAGASVASGSAVALVVSTGAPATTTVTLGGTVVGLASGGTVHVLNGADNVALNANASFTLPTAVATGATYSVSVGSPQPSGQSCAVKNGSGTAGTSNITSVIVYCTTNLTTATLTGNFTFVRDDISVDADQLLNLSFDGAGGYSGTSTLNTAGTITSPSFTGTYTVSSVSAIPRVTTDSGAGEGGAEFNASAVVALATNSLDGNQPNLFIGVAPTQNATASSVNGTYTTVSLESTNPARATLGTLTANNGTGTFSSQTRNTNGTISSPSSSGNPGTYTITASGAITIASSGVSGAASADGDLLVFTSTTSTGNSSIPVVSVAVKQGTGVTSSTLNGVYSAVSLATGSTATANVGRVYSLVLVNGQFSGTYDQNEAGTASTGNSISGTYTVAADGTFNLVVSGGSSLTGRVSADGNVFALTDITSGDAPILVLGLRQ
jgi:hypothetical protein